MGTSLGGWIGALIVGLLLYYVGPLAPGKIGEVLWRVGIVFLIVAVILLVLWLVGLVTGSAVVGMAALV